MRGEEPTTVDRLELLRAAYTEGHNLHRRLPWIGGAPTTSQEATEAERVRRQQVIDWTCATWEMLARYYQGQERKFAPEVDAALGRVGVAMATGEVLKRLTPESYVDAKLAFLAALVEREEERQSSGRPPKPRNQT